jgi:hypothetical protein
LPHTESPPPASASLTTSMPSSSATATRAPPLRRPGTCPAARSSPRRRRGLRPCPRWCEVCASHVEPHRSAAPPRASAIAMAAALPPPPQPLQIRRLLEVEGAAVRCRDP